MEKARRKRVNTCLDQLRSLLPFSTTMKRDMASLLEQTVEYINTMHTVLNEDKPDCLSKIYTLYQRKIEDYDLFRKGNTPKACKRKLSSGSGGTGTSKSSSNDFNLQSPEMWQAYPGSCNAPHNSCASETNAKRCYSGHLAWDQDIIHQAMATPVVASAQNWQPQQHIIDPVGDMNNNLVHQFPGAPHGSERMLPSCYVYGESPLTTPYQMAPRSFEQASPFPPGTYFPFSRICVGLANLPSPASEDNLQSNITPNPCCRVDSDPKSVANDPLKARKSQNCFNISNLISGEEQRECSVMQMSSQSPWNQQQNLQSSMVPFNALHKSDNPTHNLLAPMDMTESPPSNSNSASQFIGVDRLLGKGHEQDIRAYPSSGRDLGILLKTTSVSAMLNEVSGTNAAGHPKVFGSTERRITPILSYSLGTQSNGLQPSTFSVATGSRSTSAPATIENGHHVKISTPSSCSTASEKLYDDVIRSNAVRTSSPSNVSVESQELPVEVSSRSTPEISERNVPEGVQGDQKAFSQLEETEGNDNSSDSDKEKSD